MSEQSTTNSSPLAQLWWRLIRFGFRLLYNELAFTYDAVSVVVSLGQWRCWGRASLQYINAQHGECVLELAHGTGNLQRDLHRLGYKIIGFDLSPAMGRITQHKLHKANLTPQLVRGKGQRLPFASATFETIVCTFPTDFILAPATLAESQRVLKADGRLIIVPNGVLTGSGIVARGIELLYRITGQRSDDTAHVDMNEYFGQFGFITETHTVECKRSIAHVIVAHKRTTET